MSEVQNQVCLHPQRLFLRLLLELQFLLDRQQSLLVTVPMEVVMVCHRVDPGATKEESHDVNVMENQIVKETVMVIGVALHLPQFKVLQLL